LRPGVHEAVDGFEEGHLDFSPGRPDAAPILILRGQLRRKTRKSDFSPTKEAIVSKFRLMMYLFFQTGNKTQPVK
jgi:hypothetical protein